MNVLTQELQPGDAKGMPRVWGGGSGGGGAGGGADKLQWLSFRELGQVLLVYLVLLQGEEGSQQAVCSGGCVLGGNAKCFSWPWWHSDAVMIEDSVQWHHS
jgi:hypothetical protein